MEEDKVHKPIGYSMRHVRLEHRVKTHSGHYVDVYGMNCIYCYAYTITHIRRDENGHRVAYPPNTCPYGES